MEKMNVVPADEAEEYQSWALPQIDAEGNICASAEKDQAKPESHLADGESVESLEIDADEMPTNVPMVSIEELEAITQQAYDEGLKKGIEEGRPKGVEEGKKQGLQLGKKEAFNATKKVVDQEVANLTSVINVLQNPIGVQQSQIETSLMLIIRRLTEAVIQKEISSDQSYLADVVNKAVEALPVGSKNIMIAMNPEDVTYFQENGGYIRRQWQLEADPSISRGGCEVSTEHSFVDATIEARMDVIISQFLSQDALKATDSLDADEDVNQLLDQQVELREQLEREEQQALLVEQSEAQKALDERTDDNIEPDSDTSDQAQ